MSPDNKNYFYPAFFTILIAIVVFICLRIFLPDRLFPEIETQSSNIVIDSLALVAIAENEKKDTLTTENVKPKSDIDFTTTGNMEGHSYMIDFYDKLYQLETGKKKSIRIGYFSDSMTDGDLIVQDVRKQFQNKYGGKGVGFVGITSLSALSRYSVSHQYSKNWRTFSFLKDGKRKKMFGIDGQVSFVCDSASSFVEYKANDWVNCGQLYQPTLFYGKSNNQDATITASIDEENTEKAITPTNLLNTLALTTQNPKKIKLTFHQADSIPFYGVNFDDKEGIHIDNFSMRGNSGLPLSTLNTDLLKAFDNILQYDLIIIHYGANVLGYETSNYSWYEKKMEGVVQHMKKCFTSADILIVSIADKASKQDMEMKTDKAVIPLLTAQRHYAKTSESTFLNLYNLMGGENSMVKWVEEENPSLANKDYTHFNANGSKKIASLIYKEIETGYLRYKKMKEIGSID